MDDIGGLVLAILGIVVAIAVIILLVYLAVIVGPFIAGGYLFYKQVKEKYRLSATTRLKLVQIGAGAVGVGTLLVVGTGGHPLYIVPASVLLFLAASIIYMSYLGWNALAGIKQELVQSRTAEAEIKRKHAALELERGKWQSELERQRQAYDQAERVMIEFDNALRGITTSGDAALRILIKSEFEQKARQYRDSEIAARLTDLSATSQARLSRQKTDEFPIRSQIEKLVLELELQHRQAEPLIEWVRRCARYLEESGLSLQALAPKVEEATSQARQLEANMKARKTERIMI